MRRYAREQLISDAEALRIVEVSFSSPIVFKVRDWDKRRAAKAAVAILLAFEFAGDVESRVADAIGGAADIVHETNRLVREIEQFGDDPKDNASLRILRGRGAEPSITLEDCNINRVNTGKDGEP